MCCNNQLTCLDRLQLLSKLEKSLITPIETIEHPPGCEYSSGRKKSTAYLVAVDFLPILPFSYRTF
jgi:hypothetical protein